MSDPMAARELDKDRNCYWCGRYPSADDGGHNRCEHAHRRGALLDVPGDDAFGRFVTRCQHCGGERSVYFGVATRSAPAYNCTVKW